MFHTAIRGSVIAVICVAGLAIAQPAAAQRPAPPAQAPAGAEAIIDTANADTTRQQLAEVLEKYPPSVGSVLKLDPTLMLDPGYLAPYPALSAFIAQHPQVAHNPEFFLERVSGATGSVSQESLARQDFMNMVGNFTAFLVFLVVTGVLIWLIRLFVDHRRWNRLSKIQTDVHTKLLDRFSSNEDLLAYVQTTAGRRFLESAPIPLHDESRPLGAPFSRILWSVQAGIVLAAGGLGILLVSRRFVGEPAQFFFVVGMTTLALGAGFVASAVAAYALSQRLGLLDKPAADHA